MLLGRRGVGNDECLRDASKYVEMYCDRTNDYFRSPVRVWFKIRNHGSAEPMQRGTLHARGHTYGYALWGERRVDTSMIG